MSAIKIDDLKKFISRSGLSIAAAERKAGLRRNSIQNILYGKSKTASKETVEAICQVLDCTPKEITDDFSVSSPKGNYWDEELFVRVVKASSEEVDNQNISPYFEEMMLIFQDAYTYFLQSEDKEIDKIFLNWLIKKHFD